MALRGALAKKLNQAAAEYGVKLGIYGDLAVGVAGGSADTWLKPPRLLYMDVSVGAPPDPLGPTGQNWDLPPLNPSMLKHTGYEKFAPSVARKYASVWRVAD